MHENLSTWQRMPWIRERLISRPRMSFAHSLVCRPSTSGEVLVLANCEVDIPQASNAAAVAIPSDYTVSKIIEKRVRLHFNNSGEIEIEGFNIHFAVSVGGPCPLVYVCVAEPRISSERAQEFLLADALLANSQLLERFSTAGDHDLQQQIQPVLQELMNRVELRALKQDHASSIRFL
ncbi:hypothetical protein OESDEN_03069 [Oesophagostomum dentatum]|uniref:Uncharacterized protein n=1 Tax=Oesophagostomum dentatum TaxID=61180 RepID=A0A0B1TNH8_OESDE|nr:hypothetical protein OESDEN_03069 [Oesophagostomum dentatum]